MGRPRTSEVRLRRTVNGGARQPRTIRAKPKALMHIAFEATRLLRENPDIYLMLSGRGIGFDRLKAMQSGAKLPNTSLAERVP